MSTPVSYAKVAAKGPVAENDVKSIASFSGASAVDDAEPSSAVATAASVVETKSDEAAAEPSAAAEAQSSKAEKKTLAPAPVPVTSAWGASVTSDSSASASADDKKWPTPDNQVGAKGGHQKFIKPGTNKWVPINAKVILQSSRSPNQKQNRNRKKSTGAAINTNTKTTTQRKHNTQQINKKDDLGDAPAGAHSADESSETVSDLESAASATSASSHESTDSNEASQHPAAIHSNGFQNNYQYQKYQNGQQKNYRRFNNATGNPSYTNNPNTNAAATNKRFINQAPQQDQSQLGAPQNGFYHPQPYVQNQTFQNNFNNRQYRPQNGQFRPAATANTANRNNRQNFNNTNGYRPVGIPGQHLAGNGLPLFADQQAQIPPPISPKQNPQEALTQQIDYYFSLENLIRDIFLRKNMTGEGWVPLNLILDFKRVKIIINGIQNTVEGFDEIHKDLIVLDAIKQCENLEIDYINEKSIETATIVDVNLRVKDNFEQWLLPTEN